MANNVVNFKRGTAAQYNAATKDADTLYFVTSSGGSSSVEMGELFLGSIRIGVGIGTSADPSTNKTYYGLKNYVDSSFVSAVAESTQNGKIAVTKNGTTSQIAIHGLGSAAYEPKSAFIQGVDSTDTDAISFTVDSNNVANATIYLNGTGVIPLEVVPGDGISASLNASYVDGSLTTSNKLLTKSASDGYYGRLASANTWSSTNTFNGAVTIGSSTSISWATAPTNNNHLANKKYVDDQISAIGTAVTFVGESSSDPASTTGATVSGHNTWKKGEIVLYGNKEYINITGSNTSTTTPNPNWRELGDEGLYVQSVTDGTTAQWLNITRTGAAVTINPIVRTSPNGFITLGTSTANNDLYVDYNTNFISGTLSTSNKLLTQSLLSSANTWSGSNTFSSTLTAGGNFNVTGGTATIDPSTSVTINANGSSVLTSDGGDTTLGDIGTDLTITGNSIFSGIIACSTAPTNGSHLTNKTYVDSAVTAALTWASI